MIATEEHHLEQCRRLIEARLGWGEAKAWSHLDFLTLSEKIFECTGVQLSHTTLKRLWGRVRYESAPTLATLNTLALFAGYENWRAFQISHPGGERSPAILVGEIQQLVSARNTGRRVWLVALVGVLIFAVALLWAFRRQQRPLRYGSVTFTSRPVARGLPNTVQFRYDATDSNADSVFIQQSWDPRRRFQVDKTAHQYASTYYYPGYFRAKLVLNDSVVSEHDLYLRSEGWLGTLDREPIPVYFRRPQQPGGVIGLTEVDLAAQQVDFQSDIPWTSLFNVQELGDLPGDDFAFETRLRSTFNRSNAVCQYTYVVLQCSNGHHWIPLAIPGCVGELKMTFGDTNLDGKTSDLSGFGVDFSNWVSLRCEVREKAVRVFVNDRLAWQGRFTKNVGKLVGVRYRFHGTGEVASTVFRRARGQVAKELL